MVTTYTAPLSICSSAFFQQSAGLLRVSYDLQNKQLSFPLQHEGNISGLHWESYETHKYKMQS
jgi:hypothetical protein